MKCARIYRGLKNGSGGSLDTKPVGNGGGGCQALSCEDIDDCGEMQLFSSCLQFHFPCNLAEQSINRRSAKEQKSEFMIN